MHEGEARPALALEALASARRSLLLAAAVLVPLSLCAAVPLCASSHGDAPALARMPEGAAAHLNGLRSYTVRVLRGPASHPTSGGFLTNTGGGARFAMPFDDIGGNTIPEYDASAAQFVYDVNIPGCAAGPGRLFAGQRKDPFAMNLGE